MSKAEEILTVEQIANFAVNNTNLPSDNRRVLKATLMGFITAKIEQEFENRVKAISDERIDDRFYMANVKEKELIDAAIKWFKNQLLNTEQ
jgi:hypothetical protein